jgi:type VI secretion system protein
MPLPRAKRISPPSSRPLGAARDTCAHRGARGWLRVAVLAFSCALIGCTSIDNALTAAGGFLTGTNRPSRTNWERIVITASEDVNQNSPVALDIVWVKEPAMLEALLNTPAAKWFASRSELQRSFPQAFTVINLELVPKQSLVVDESTLSAHKGLAVLLYADYPSPGDHRERLAPRASGYTVQLDARNFKATAVNPGGDTPSARLPTPEP